MRQRYKKGLLVSIGFLGLIALIYYSGLGKYFTLHSLKEKSGYFKSAVENNYARSVVIYLLVYTFLILVTLPVVGPMTLLGGYLFGFLPGFGYALASATVGSFLSFIIIKYALNAIMKARFKERLEPLQEKMKVHGGSYLLMLQLLSIVPYVIINTLAAATDVAIPKVFITTLLGSVPLLLIYAWAGQKLSAIYSVKSILSPNMLFVLLVLALLSLLPIVIKRWKK